jgi:endonuclease/exonuclease/phosphatase family metal-dependent hydrolase
MYFSTTLLDDIFEIRHNNTWKSYFWSVMSFCINFPLDIFCFLKLHLYLYLISLSRYAINSRDIELSSSNEENRDSEETKILSWNIQYGNGFFRFNNLIKSIRYMQSQNLDIILLQEVLVTESLNQVDLFKKCLSYPYHFFHPKLAVDDLKMGNLILSRYPLTLVYEESTFQIVKIKMNHPTKYSREEIYLINVHLNCDLLCQQQKRKISKIIQEIKNIKKKNTNKKTRILMAGDFNLLSWSQYLKKLNTEINLVLNNEYTYPSNYPLVKYDYVFQLGLEETINLEIPQITFSDHLPLLITI